MACICPKDMKPCPDDLCRGSGYCLQSVYGHAELLELCAVCRKPYGELVDCDCDEDGYDEDGGWEVGDRAGSVREDKDEQ